MHLSLIAALVLGTGVHSADAVGPFVQAFWFIQQYGTTKNGVTTWGG